MRMRTVEGPAYVEFEDGSSTYVASGEQREVVAEWSIVTQYGLHGGNVVDRITRLNALGRQWREVVRGDEWVFHEFTATATAYIHALEAECDRVGIVIERPVE